MSRSRDVQWSYAATLGIMALTLALELYHGWVNVRVPQFWGEEGRFFYKQAYEGGLTPLLQTCQGYLHVFPRFVAFVSTLLPMKWAPSVAIGGAVLGQLLTFSLVCSRRLPLAPLARALCIVAVACNPTRGEVLLNLTNVQWYLAPGIVLVLLRSAPRQPRELLVDVSWLLLLGFTGPYIVLFVPLCAAARLRRSAPLPTLERWRWLYASSIALVHGLMWSLDERQTHRLVTHINDTFEAWAGTFANAVLPFFFASFSPWVHQQVSAPWLMVAVVGSIGCAWLMFADRASRRDPLRWALLLCGGVCSAAGMWETRDLPLLMHPYGNGERSFFMLYLAVAWVLAMTVTSEIPRGRRIAAASVLLISAGFSVASFGTVAARPNYNYPLQVKIFEQQGQLTFHQPPDWTYHLKRADAWNP